jgi:thiol:disulfide interchange protein DsbD
MSCQLVLAVAPTLFSRMVRVKTTLALALMTLTLSLCQPATARGEQAVPPGAVVTLTPLAESPTVHAGSTIRLALQVKVADGYHIQSDRPRDPTIIPAKLTLTLPPGVSLVDTSFPDDSEFRLKGSDDILDVFEHDFTVGVRLAIDKNQAPGSLTLPGRFRSQACNDSTCLIPKTLETAWTVQIVPPTAKVTTAHADVFRAIEFGRVRAPRSSAAAAVEPAPTERPAAGSVSAAGDGIALLDSRFDILATTNYVSSAEFLQFIHDAEAGVKQKGLFEGRGPLAIIALVFIGGLALNLTPCVLPMIPINLAIIGAGTQAGRRSRGLLLGGTYGAAMALVYGLIGLVVILTAGTFGTINASPWFNLGIAVLFVVLGLAMFDIGAIDLSRLSGKVKFKQESRGTFLLAFGMGAVAALLAGACVAPVVIQVVIFASNLYATGTTIALALPFFLGLGMAVPWPVVGAGLASLPKPGAWMERVKYAFGVFILATAVYYGYVAYGIFASRWVDPETVRAGVAEKLKEGWHSSLAEGLTVAEQGQTLVLLDLWATWCKNCLIADKTTLADPAVVTALSGYTRIKFQAEDPGESPAKELMQRLNASGLPTYAILRLKSQSGAAPR